MFSGYFAGPNSDENADVITTSNERTSVVCSTNNQLTTIAGRSSANHIMVPITQHQQQQLQSTVTTLTTQSQHNQQQSIIQLPAHQQQQLLQQPHGNIILVRGSRNENGQIVLQNSQELLNLLNDEDKPPILLQHPRFKANKQSSSEGAIFLQPTVKSSQLDGHHHGTVLLQSATVKKSTNLPEGSIIVQQRLNKNGTADGPILLQTLKRLDKSQSILVFRNPNNTSTATAITTNTTNTTTSNRSIKHIVASDDGDNKLEAQLPVATPAAPTKSINTPLGSGKYIFFPLYAPLSFVIYILKCLYLSEYRDQGVRVVYVSLSLT